MVYLICMGRQQQIILHIKAIFIQVKANHTDRIYWHVKGIARAIFS